MNVKPMKELYIEKYIDNDSIVDVTELRRKYHLTTEQMDSAIKKAQLRGHSLYCVNGRLFRAKNMPELEKKLNAIRDSYRTNSIEHAVKKNFNHRVIMEGKNK